MREHEEPRQVAGTGGGLHGLLERGGATCYPVSSSNQTVRRTKVESSVDVDIFIKTAVGATTRDLLPKNNLTAQKQTS